MHLVVTSPLPSRQYPNFFLTSQVLTLNVYQACTAVIYYMVGLVGGMVLVCVGWMKLINYSLELLIV